MLVRNRMTPDPYTVQASASINTLIGMMREKHLRKVPVLDGSKLVGIVTEKDIERVSPSKATTLSVYEIHYLLSKLTVAEAMTKNPITCSPDEYIEDAALLMRQNRVNSLIVVEDDKILGIVTESDLFDALIDMMGGRIPGNKFVLKADNVPGVLERLGRVIAERGTNISHFSMVQGGETAMLYVRTASNIDPETVRKALEGEGFEIADIRIRK